MKFGKDFAIYKWSIEYNLGLKVKTFSTDVSQEGNFLGENVINKQGLRSKFDLLRTIWFFLRTAKIPLLNNSVVSEW